MSNELYNELHFAVDTNTFLSYQIDMLEDNGWELDSTHLSENIDGAGWVEYTWEWCYYNDDLDDLTLTITFTNKNGWLEIKNWDIEKGLEI